MFLINAASYLLRSPQIATGSAIVFDNLATQREKRRIIVIASAAFAAGLAYGACIPPPPALQRENSEVFMAQWIAANAVRFAIEGMSVIANIGLMKLVYDRLYGH